MNLIDKIRNILNESPLFKSIIGIFSLFFCAIVVGWFMVEITLDNGQLNWGLFYKTTSFLVMLFFCFLVYLYYRFLYILPEKKEVHVFKDNDYCKAYMRRECLPELAKKAKALIKSENDSKKLREIIEDLNI